MNNVQDALVVHSRRDCRAAGKSAGLTRASLRKLDVTCGEAPYARAGCRRPAVQPRFSGSRSPQEA
jgi:hypothetical protein